MLEPILESTRRRVAALPSVAELQRGVEGLPPSRSLADALAATGLRVIAEIKRRSPSAGPLAPDLDPAQLAGAYVAGGAAAISVLTEPDFFGGSLNDLRVVRESVEVPLLRKDFVIDERQIWEARLAGADAVLLIVAVLGDRVGGLLDAARRAGVAAVVEAHTADEAQLAVGAGATIIGVNNRDLTSFVTDLAVAEGVAASLPAHVVRIAESGVADPGGARRMAAAGYDAILVGEALVRTPDPAALLRTLRDVP